jgi:hypothetical protein
MYPRPINRALCSAGITAGGSFTDVSPTLSREANSSLVSGFDGLWTIILVCPFPLSRCGQFCSVRKSKAARRVFLCPKKRPQRGGANWGRPSGTCRDWGPRHDNPLAQNPFQPYSRLNLCTACADKKPPEDCAVRTRYNAASIIQLGGVVHFNGLFRICEWPNSASTALGYWRLSIPRQGEWFLLIFRVVPFDYA